MSTPFAIRTSKGPIALGKLIGKGGEASVFEIAGSTDKVAKIYHAPKPDQSMKVAAMLPIANADLLALTAWPLDLLYGKTGSFTGIVLPRVSGHKDIHNLYSPRSRKAEFPNADWRFLIRAAANTARAFAAVHQAKCVIGDVNHGGVLVSDKATVRIIDCDSFQFEANGKRFFCDVGVPTFTPPELQGKPFRGVVRTPNHDNFGLAILVFHLLYMGRHPFAGRFLGRGDMSLEKAITEFRFAYGANRAAYQMEPPPNVPGIAIASPAVAALFERAMAPGAVQNGARPTARDWIGALDGLEKTLKTCAINSSHAYFNGLDRCPWCHLEAATGAVLFNAWIQRGPQAAFGGVDAVWATIMRVPSPGALPVIGDPSPSPSSQALAHGRARRSKMLVGHGGLVAAVICLIAAAPQATMLILLAALVAWFVVANWASSGHSLQTFRNSEKAALDRWKALKARWDIEASDQEFVSQLRQLQNERDQLRDLPALRQRRYQQLERDREKVQRQRFLERFEIEKAKISGIGPSRTVMLASYNIETAWDVAEHRIMNVPGFGPALTRELMAWRRGVESRFRFDPSKGVDPQDIAALDRELAGVKGKLEQNLAAGAQRLTEIRNRTLARRAALQPQLEEAARTRAQATADLQVA
ncbi:MAG: protein kinase domain-containing protein [Hyphomicrobiales bacterium]|nr:protein kinase domain-containing protein [Hyphomicrobiales bacterium]MCC2106719.1 protein kinase domain-containing protein [Hyphomicrobiales bacterium]HPG03007.1 protein kinase domain-containing protein [Rhodoblastus sp.]